MPVAIQLHVAWCKGVLEDVVSLGLGTNATRANRTLRTSILGLTMLVRISFTLLLVLVPIVVWENVPRIYHFPMDPLFICSLLLIGTLTIAMILFEVRDGRLSLHIIHWSFSYVFFFIAPLAQYKYGRFPWGHLTPDEADILVLTNFAILAWMGAWIFARLLRFPRFTQPEVVHRPIVSRYGVWLVLAGGILSTLLLLRFVGISGLLTRAGYTEALSSVPVPSSIRLVFDKLTRALPVAALIGLGALVREKRSVINTVLFVMGAFMVVLTNFPLGGARYWMASVYLGFVLSFGRRWFGSSLGVATLILVGLLVVFPLLSAGRHASSVGEYLASIRLSDLIEGAFVSGDFDAYSMIAHTLLFIKESGLTYGRQLLGVILFMVPRSWWPDKPTGSGWTVAEGIGLSYQNVSSPLPAEGLINFGWIGLLAFAFGFSRLFTWLDKKSRSSVLSGSSRLVRAVYPFLFGLFVFMLRGDLLSSSAFIVGFVTAFLPLTGWPQLRRATRTGREPLKAPIRRAGEHCGRGHYSSSN